MIPAPALSCVGRDRGEREASGDFLTRLRCSDPRAASRSDWWGCSGASAPDGDGGAAEKSERGGAELTTTNEVGRAIDRCAMSA